MRTKTLLAAAAIVAAGIASSMAQSNVYSLNVVGYVNKSFQAGLYTLVSSPLKNGANTLKDLIPNPPDNTIVQRWSVAAQDLDVVIPTYVAGSGNWVPNPVILPGEGFFVVNGDGSGSFTNTFVGEVQQGSITNAIAGNSAYQAIGSPVPIGGNIATVLSGYVASDNDIIQTWNVPAQDLDVAIPTYVAGSGTWIPDATIGVADGFFLVRADPGVNWVRNFTVQ